MPAMTTSSRCDSTSRSPIFFSTAPPPTEIYTLSLHDALPIYAQARRPRATPAPRRPRRRAARAPRSARGRRDAGRSEEHTSELQSRFDLVCRLLLEKKKKQPRQRQHWLNESTAIAPIGELLDA